ncbi:hypothetical protein N643_09670 [Salmonella bongori serovar 48:z41:-- str. RKS3044]|nr:hypothetical protein N643_09670 [Salmonella bongori serovar 48:z41:-- str. RKS3044]
MLQVNICIINELFVFLVEISDFKMYQMKLFECYINF